jgi:ribosomal protein S17E
MGQARKRNINKLAHKVINDYFDLGKDVQELVRAVIELESEDNEQTKKDIPEATRNMRAGEGSN